MAVGSDCPGAGKDAWGIATEMVQASVSTQLRRQITTVQNELWTAAEKEGFVSEKQ